MLVAGRRGPIRSVPTRTQLVDGTEWRARGHVPFGTSGSFIHSFPLLGVGDCALVVSV